MEKRLTNLQKIMMAVVVDAACPYQTTDLVGDKIGMASHTEIRVGREAQDGFIRNFSHMSGGPYDDDELWTGHFWGQKFTLTADHVSMLIARWASLDLLERRKVKVVNEANFEDAMNILNRRGC